MTQTRSGKKYSAGSQAKPSQGSAASAKSQSSESSLRLRRAAEGNAPDHEQEQNPQQKKQHDLRHLEGCDENPEASASIECSASDRLTGADDQPTTLGSPRFGSSVLKSIHSPKHHPQTPNLRSRQAFSAQHASIKSQVQPGTERAETRYKQAEPPTTLPRSGSGASSFYWLAVAIAAALVVLAIAVFITGSIRAGGQQQHVHHHELLRTLSDLVGSAEDNQLKDLHEHLKGEHMGSGAPKAPGIVVLCSTSAHCKQVVQFTHSSIDSSCSLHINNSSFSDMYGAERGRLQLMVVNFLNKCSRGVLTFDNVLLSGINNVYTLIAMMSEGGSLMYDGKSMSTAQLSLLFVEQVDEVWPLLTLSDIVAAKQHLREKVVAGYASLLSQPTGSQVQVTLDALMRRLDYFFSAQNL